MLSTRLKELKDALADRVQVMASNNLKGFHSSGPASNPSGPSLPTPDTGGGLSRRRNGDQTPMMWTERRPKCVSSDDSQISQSRMLGEAQLGEPNDEDIRPRPGAVDRKLDYTAAPTTRPALTEVDLTELEDDMTNAEIIPPSTPPREPSRSTQRSSKATNALKQKGAPAELVDVSIDAFFSSPQHATSHRPPRAETSSARSALGGPGPSSSANIQRVQAQKAVKVDVQHPWSKEVNQKLRQVFKLPGFRTHQREAIDETMAGKDGESLCSS